MSTPGPAVGRAVNVATLPVPIPDRALSRWATWTSHSRSPGNAVLAGIAVRTVTPISDCAALGDEWSH